TDAEGRFRLKGIGRERLVSLRIEGPTIVATELWAMTRPGTEVRAASWRRGLGEDMIFVGANFDHLAAPSRPVVGIVRGKVTDKATSKPVHSIIHYAVFQDNPFRQEAPGLTFDQQMQTRAEDGTFRFVGLPGHTVVAAQAWAGQYLRGVGFNRIKELAPPF